MHTVYVLLFTTLLYVLFNTIVDVIIATSSSTQLFRIKAKVFFHTFAAPVIFLLVILFVILTDNKAFSIYWGIGLIVGSLIRAFFGDRKYITRFQVENQQSDIEYLTSLLKKRRFRFALTDLSNIEIEKANWLVDFPASLNIKYKDEALTFYVIDKPLKAVMQRDVETANKLLPQAKQDIAVL